MPRTRTHPYATLPGVDWRAWFQAWEVAMATPEIIAHRTARMMLGGWPPSARDQSEYVRMFQEKGEAFVESWIAATLAWQRGGAIAMQQGLGPVHRRVTANRRRLARTAI
jgi:hypothetical protein